MTTCTTKLVSLAAVLGVSLYGYWAFVWTLALSGGFQISLAAFGLVLVATVSAGFALSILKENLSARRQCQCKGVIGAILLASLWLFGIRAIDNSSMNKESLDLLVVTWIPDLAFVSALVVLWRAFISILDPLDVFDGVINATNGLNDHISCIKRGYRDFNRLGIATAGLLALFIVHLGKGNRWTDALAAIFVALFLAMLLPIGLRLKSCARKLVTARLAAVVPRKAADVDEQDALLKTYGFSASLGDRLREITATVTPLLALASNKLSPEIGEKLRNIWAIIAPG